MRIVLALAFSALISLAAVAVAQPTTPDSAPRVDDRVSQIPQSVTSTSWAFIGYGVITPATDWFVTDSTPRGGTLGRHLSAGEAHSAVLVMASESLDKPVESDAALLELTRARHARIGDRWAIQRHDETLVRHAGTRCARHVIDAREPETLAPRKDADKINAQRTALFVSGLSCIHPTDASALVEIGVSERSRGTALSPSVKQDVEAIIASLAFHRYNEQALQKSAEAARSRGLADAQAVLKPYIDADAAWARYFMAQILERASPAPEQLGERLRALLEPAAERGLADAQWMLGRLLLQGAPGVQKDPGRADALLRRAAEHGNPGAAFQLGLSLLSGADGIAGNSRDGALWIQRAAFRGQKEAQELLASARVKPAVPTARGALKDASKR